MGLLVRSITISKGGEREPRHRWPKARKSKEADTLCEALHKQWAASAVETASGVHAIYEKWLAAQQQLIEEDTGEHGPLYLSFPSLSLIA